VKKALEIAEITQILQSKSFGPLLFHESNFPKYLNRSALSRKTVTTIVPKRRPRIGISIAAKASSGVRTWNMTISIAPSRDPAVLPIGRKGTHGKTARTQKIAKATEPRTTVGGGDSPILVLKQATIPKFPKNFQTSTSRSTQ